MDSCARARSRCQLRKKRGRREIAAVAASKLCRPSGSPPPSAARHIDVISGRASRNEGCMGTERRTRRVANGKYLSVTRAWRIVRTVNEETMLNVRRPIVQYADYLGFAM